MIKTMLGLLVVGAWVDCAQAELLRMKSVRVRVRIGKIFIGT
jgi:hypothetical protein